MDDEVFLKKKSLRLEAIAIRFLKVIFLRS